MSGALSDARAVVVVGLAGLVASCAPEGPSSVTPVDVAPMDGVLLVASSVDDVRGPHARIERWVFGGGEPEVTTLEEPRSDVMHVVRCDPAVPGGFLSGAGNDARISRWSLDRGAWRASDLFHVQFRPGFSRVRDFEIVDRARLGVGDGLALAVGTHDGGLVALVGLDHGEVRELDRADSTFVHEIEVGDLDGDGLDEIYATTSPPNAVALGAPQRGDILRLSPRAGTREVLVHLEDRHAKEILVEDVDRDGRDELYAVIEGRLDEARQLVAPVEIRAIGSDGSMRTIASLPDAMTRFLATADLDGDGQRELVAATFSHGLHWLRRAADGAWSSEAIDEVSGGFEHAITVGDLDHDGRDELYEADDPRGELRRIRLGREGIVREILARYPAGSRITWSLATCPATPGGA